MTDTILPCLIVIAGIGIVVLLVRRLGGMADGSVRTLWYFFSLAFYATTLTGWLASVTGAIDSHGHAHGEAGAFIFRVVEVMLDLNTDALVMAALASLVVVPQLLSYLLSGLSGHASNAIFVQSTIRLLIWGIAKSFAVASGILTSIALLGLSIGWTYFDAIGATQYLFTGTLAIALAFATILGYLHADELVDLLRRKHLGSLADRLRTLHGWNMRHRKRDQSYKCAFGSLTRPSPNYVNAETNVEKLSMCPVSLCRAMTCSKYFRLRSASGRPFVYVKRRNLLFSSRRR